MASARRTLKIEEIRAAETYMFWFDRLTMFLILSFSDDHRSDFLDFAFAACLLVFTHYNYVVLYLERRRIGHPYSSEVDANFNRLAFYGERIGFLVVILWLALGWPFAFEMTLLLFAFINGLYMLRYQKLQEEECARTRTTQESEKTEADAAGVAENKQSESENKVQEEQKPVQTDKDDKSEEFKTYVDNQRLSSVDVNQIDLYKRLCDAKLRIKELEDQCVEHNKEKADLTTTLDRVTKSLYIFSKELTRLRKENSDLVTQLSETNSWYEFQVRTTLDYENRNTILEHENKKLQYSLQLLNELTSSYKFYKSCYESMEEDYMKLMEEKIELSAKLDAKVDVEVVDEMEENCRRLEQEKTELMYENSASKFAAEAAVSKLKVKCESLEQEKTELMSDAKVAAEAVNELEVNCESLKQEKILLLYEISATKQVYDEDVNELKDKCERLEQENTDLMSEVSAAKIYRSYLHDLDDDDDDDDLIIVE